MAEIIGSQSINNVNLIEVDDDPRSGGGTPAAIGDLAIVNIGSFPLFQKFESGDLDWRPISVTSFAHYSNAQTTQNLNVNPVVGVQIYGNEVERSDDFTFQNNISVQCNFDGFVRASYQIHLFSNQTRPNLRVQFFKNFNEPIGPIGASGYIRDTSGHQESSIDGYTIIPVTSGDTIQLAAEREAGNGTVTLAELETSNIILERY